MADEFVPREDMHGLFVDKHVADKLITYLGDASDHAAIADLAAPSAAYVEAEALAARDKINEILDVLRDAGLIPTS